MLRLAAPVTSHDKVTLVPRVIVVLDAEKRPMTGCAAKACAGMNRRTAASKRPANKDQTDGHRLRACTFFGVVGIYTEFGRS